MYEDEWVDETEIKREEEDSSSLGPNPRKDEPRHPKRTCLLCGRSFSYNLTYYRNGDKVGYICTTCHMNGPPVAPLAPDSQTKLDGSEAKV